MTLEGGDTWDLDGHTFTVPSAVDGDRVFRSYAPDCSANSAYRCNSTDGRIRSGLATSEANDINSADEDRWIGFALYIDGELDMASMSNYAAITPLSTHSPSSHQVTGPLKLVFTKSAYSPTYRWEIHSSFDATSSAGLTAGGCDGDTSSISGGYHCGFRKLPMLTGSDKLEFDMDTDLDHWIYFVFHYRWDNSGTGQDGEMEVWMRRHNESEWTQIVDYTGYVGLMTNDPCYLKAGVSAINDQSCPYVFYYDNLRVGDSSFAEVDPLQDGSPSCGPSSPTSCTTEGDCTAAGLNWCSGVCQVASCASLILYESWESSDGNDLPYGSGDDRLYISTSPDYCVNPSDGPSPPSGCSYSQFMGYPPVQTANTCCQHSINIGTTAYGFPVHSGSRSLRFFLEDGDAEVKDHDSRAEMIDRYIAPGGTGTTVLNEQRWYGWALYIEGSASDGYEEVNCIQWHHPNTGNGVPGLLKLDDYSGGKRWFWVTTAPVGTWDIMGQIDASGDFNRWIHFVINLQWDRDAGEGFVKVWKDDASGVYTKFVDSPYVYQESSAPYMKIGIDYATSNSLNDRPFKWYFDSFRIGDENSSFAEVDPQQDYGDYCSVSTPENCTNQTSCEAVGLNWCTDTCQVAACSGGSAPVLTLVQPTTTLPYGTSGYTTQLTSDVSCTARFQYSASDPDCSSWTFDTATGVPTSTEPGTTHEKEMPSVNNASDFYQCWYCRNEDGDATPVEVHIDVADSGGTDTTAPTASITSVSVLPVATDHVTVEVETDEVSTCKASETPGTAFASMEYTLSETADNIHHYEGIGIGQYRKSIHVKCQDASGNESDEESISVNVMAESTKSAGASF